LQYAGSPFERDGASPLGDHFDLEGVGSVREMKVVRLGRPQGQDSHLVRWRGLDLVVIQLIESALLHREGLVSFASPMGEFVHARRLAVALVIGLGA
jgi:hypothetical protein